MTEANGDLVAFGRELSNTVNPMWLLRTLPNNVLGHIGIKYGLKGANACITNHSVGGLARGDRGQRGAAQRRSGPRGGGGPRDADRAADGALLSRRGPCWRPRSLRPFDAARDGSQFGEGAGALVLETEASAASRGARGAGRSAGRRLRDRRPRACSRSAPTAMGRSARSRQALDDAGDAARRRRHDRRARERHAAVGQLRRPPRSRACSAPRCRRSPASSGRSATSSPPPASSKRRWRSPRSRTTSCPASRRCASSIPRARACRCRRRRKLPRSTIALDQLPRLRRAPTLRCRAWCIRAAMTESATPCATLRHRLGRDRPHRAPAAREHRRGARRAFSRRRRSRTRATVRAAPRASPRASPRRKRA